MGQDHLRFVQQQQQPLCPTPVRDGDPSHTAVWSSCVLLGVMVGVCSQAIRSDNPIIFFEHVLLYNIKGETHDGDYCQSLEKAEVG